MTELAIQTRGLTRRFGELTAVNHLDLEIASGAIYGFLGPNGSGKTTAIRMLCGLLTPTEGEATVLGLSVNSEAEQLRNRFGYMAQKFALYGELSVRENMEFMGRIYKMPRADLQRRIRELLEIYDLGELERRRVAAMSGGQRQRVALACAVLHSPPLLFLDEPTSAVDPQTRRDFWERLFDLSDAGTTILVSTHYMDEAERCHELAILELGSLRAAGPPDQLMQGMGATVVELSDAGLRELKPRILELPSVKSASQQGVRLRVMVDASEPDPLAYLRSALSAPDLQMEIARPSLEDVFVSVTGGRTT